MKSLMVATLNLLVRYTLDRTLQLGVSDLPLTEGIAIS